MRKIITGCQIKHVYQQQSGWCGIACWEMLFSVIQPGITQKQLKSFMSDPKWGTSHEDMKRIAQTYFNKFNIRKNWTIAQLAKVLAGNFIILNIWDDFETANNEDPDGHYVVLHQILDDNLVIFDPSASKRLKSYNKIYSLSFSELNKRWYDYLDSKLTQKSNHWATVVDPTTIKNNFLTTL